MLELHLIMVLYKTNLVANTQFALFVQIRSNLMYILVGTLLNYYEYKTKIWFDNIITCLRFKIRVGWGRIFSLKYVRIKFAIPNL